MNATSFLEALPNMGRDWAKFEYSEYMRKCVKNGVQAKSFIDFIRFVLFEMPEPSEKIDYPIDF